MSKNGLRVVPIVFKRCSSKITSKPILTLWRRHSGILPFKTGMTSTLQMLSMYHPLPINDELRAERIRFGCSVARICFFHLVLRQVHHLRHTHSIGMCHYITLTSLSDSSEDVEIPHFQLLFDPQINEDFDMKLVNWCSDITRLY
jgi:hypothetical protein